jgi:hypothetical protein
VADSSLFILVVNFVFLLNITIELRTSINVGDEVDVIILFSR